MELEGARGSHEKLFRGEGGVTCHTEHVFQRQHSPTSLLRGFLRLCCLQLGTSGTGSAATFGRMLLCCCQSAELPISLSRLGRK